MRLVFLGTSDFAVASLRALAASPHEVALVVTQPDRGAGRGRAAKPPPVKTAALALELPVFQPERINTRAARAAVREVRPEVAVVAAYGQILRPLLLALPPHGCLNVHASLLPRHRGASPIAAAVMAGDEEVGVTIMRMDEGLDTGPMALRRSLPADPRETAGELHDRLAPLGGELIVEALDLLERDELTYRPQDDAEATYAPMMRKEDGAVDFRSSAAAVDRGIRARTPWPGGYAELSAEGRSRRIIVERAMPLEEDVSAEPGVVVRVAADSIVVACGTGALEIFTLKPAGRRAMSVRDYLNGTRIVEGDRFLLRDDDEPTA